ncbi:hypothetical protein PDJAM_G00000110 [Pangasius djambal]|uniref:Uncharacterized protein n=1 Tax=Pangasius djambal TaxID=1691987 RepID=A0ACC5XXF7_9TELE|nr:hypothetical protein [Pangasius djambal]
MPTASSVNHTGRRLLLLLWATHLTMATNWLSLVRVPRSRPVSGSGVCVRLRGLSVGQVGVCRTRGEVMESVRRAAEMVIDESERRSSSERTALLLEGVCVVGLWSVMVWMPLHVSGVGVVVEVLLDVEVGPGSAIGLCIKRS